MNRDEATGTRTRGYTGSGGVSVWQECLSIGLFIALVSYFWWPALAAGKVIVHGDAAHHGLSLLTMLHQWLHQELDSLLWSSGIYGGHPLFAESQGGFLNPINVVVAYFFQPTDAFGIIHWLDMLASGLGVYVLCRLLSIGSWPALFAACAVTHGTIWLMAQSNLTVHGSLVWVAWTMAAVQYWLNAPSFLRTVLMALPATFLVFAGYPHLAHALVVYFLCMVTGWLLCSEGRYYLSENFWALVAGSATAVFLALCLSAIQLLPLMELVENSHRSDGVDLLFGNALTAKAYFSGTLFFSWIDKTGLALDVFGALSASILVALCLLLKTNYKITGYLLATFVLYNLGIGNASPLFRFVYEYGLIPGLRGFRIMQPFLLIAVIGLGVLAAFAMSSLSSVSRSIYIWPLRSSQELPVLAAFFFLCLAASYYFFTASTSWWNYVFAIISLGVILILIYTGKRRWIGPALSLLLVAEIMVLRNGIYNFYDVSVLEKPVSIAAVQQDEDYQDFYAYDSNSRAAMEIFASRSNDPDFGNSYPEITGSLIPFPALKWGISSINGSLALPLHRRAILEDVIKTESTGNSHTPAGRRLIDVLGIRYFSFNLKTDVPGFSNVFSKTNGKLLIYRNDYALPKLRSYFKAQPANSSEDAMNILTRLDPDTVVIESIEAPVNTELRQCPPNSAAAQIQRQEFSSQYYRIAVDSPCAGWLYLGDAYYPGWSARVNGEPAQLYAAQVLGKAVNIPQGSSVVEFVYRPQRFYTGAIISGVAWLALCLFMLWWVCVPGRSVSAES